MFHDPNQFGQRGLAELPTARDPPVFTEHQHEPGVWFDGCFEFYSHQLLRSARPSLVSDIRDLAARIRYLTDAFVDESLNSVERGWLLKLLFQIYESHDPGGVPDNHEQIWRLWVRIELWRAADSLTELAGKKPERAEWVVLARRLRRRLGISNLPPSLRSQAHLVVRALRERV